MTPFPLDDGLDGGSFTPEFGLLITCYWAVGLDPPESVIERVLRTCGTCHDSDSLWIVTVH
jgi:hypothetical protein